MLLLVDFLFTSLTELIMWQIFPEVQCSWTLVSFHPFFLNLKHAFQVLALYKYKPFIGKILYVSPLLSVDYFTMSNLLDVFEL